MKIAVLGANGRLAHAVAVAFLAHGHEVVAVTRSGRCDGLTGRVEYRAADAMDRAQVIAATMGVDMIFNGLNPPYDKWEGFVLPMARNVMAAAKENRAVHLFIGNVYNYGKEIGLEMTDDAPFSPTTKKPASASRWRRCSRRPQARASRRSFSAPAISMARTRWAPGSTR